MNNIDILLFCLFTISAIFVVIFIIMIDNKAKEDAEKKAVENVNLFAKFITRTVVHTITKDVELSNRFSDLINININELEGDEKRLIVNVGRYNILDRQLEDVQEA